MIPTPPVLTATHAVENQAHALENYNAYTRNLALQEAVAREHAGWASTEYGFRAVIAPGFADIFYNNSLKNGLLPVTLPEDQVAMLWDLVEEQPDTTISIDLDAQTVTLPDGQQAGFATDEKVGSLFLHDAGLRCRPKDGFYPSPPLPAARIDSVRPTERPAWLSASPLTNSQVTL